jgi:Phage tail protein/Carbohydrate binding domain
MPTGLTYVRGRVAADNIETGAVPRATSQFAAFPGARLEEATTNLHANPSAEVGTTRYVATGAGVTVSRVATWAAFGAYSIEVAVDGTAANQGCRYDTGASGIAVAASTAYAFSAQVQAVSGSTALQLSVDWYTAAGVFISTSTANFTATTAGSRPTLLATSPATAAFAAPGVRTQASTASTWREDGLQFEQKTYATSYADGSLGLGYAWSGTAHASTSVRAQGQVLLAEEGTTNLLPNPSFEVDTTGWELSGASTVARDLTTARVGGASLKVTAANASGSGVRAYTAASSGFDVTPGRSYTFSSYARLGAGGSKSLTVSISWYDTAGALISTSSQATTLNTTNWSQRLAVTGVAPTSAASARNFTIETNSASGIFDFYLDAAQFEEKANATRYCDGSQGPGQYWTGDRQASASVRTGSTAPLKSLLSASGGSVIVWWAPGHDSGNGAGPAKSTLLQWALDATSMVHCYFDRALGGYVTYRGAPGGTQASSASAASFTAGAGQVAYHGWDATNVEVASNGGAPVTTAASAASRPTLSGADVFAGVNAASLSGSDTGGAIAAIACFNRRLTVAEWQFFAALVRPPLLGERVGSAMVGLWYGGHRLAWTLPSSAAAIDLNDVDGSDFRLLALHGAGTPPVVNRMVETPLRDGAVFVDTRLRPRMLLATLLVQGPGGWADLWAKRREILAAVNPRRGAGVLSFAPHTEAYEIDALFESGLEFSSALGPFAQNASLLMRCDDPAWRHAVSNEVVSDSRAGGWAVATSTPLSVAESGVRLAVTNAGDLPSYATFVLQMNGLNVEDPQLLGNGKLLRLDEAYETGDTVTVDMNGRAITSAAGTNLMGRRTAQSEMWALEPGANDVQVSQSAGAMTARMRWWTRLLGV